MPVHDWTRVDAGILHAFHHRWISALSDVLNGGLLPPEFYALPEQQTGAFGPDVLTLQLRGSTAEDDDDAPGLTPGTAGSLVTAPKATFIQESDLEFYRRKQNSLVVRHVSGDRIIAMIEVVSPGNKSSRKAFEALLNKIAWLIDNRVHVLIVDLIPPTKRDPRGIHAAIWEEVSGIAFQPPDDRPLTLVAYESDLSVRAHVTPVRVGDSLPEMPLFLLPERCVRMPLEETSETSFRSLPKKYRDALTA